MTERAVATTETARLAKLIKLIFSTDKPGEIVAAVMAAKRVLDNNDRDGHWIADRFALGAAPAVVTPDDETSERDRDDGNDRPNIWFAYHHRHRLSPKECRFVENIASRPAPLSARQRQWLADIVNRLVSS